jgi:hypothetical protein
MPKKHFFLPEGRLLAVKVIVLVPCRFHLSYLKLIKASQTQIGLLVEVLEHSIEFNQQVLMRVAFLMLFLNTTKAHIL